jgi:ElaB/YqjD/DUF883 family membrane-anchored ribosome-binding protein
LNLLPRETLFRQRVLEVQLPTVSFFREYPHMNNQTSSRAPGGTRPPQSPQTLGGSVGTAVDSAVNTMEGAVDRGKAMASDAGAAASDMAESATQQIKTFASELEGMARRNPLGTVAGAVIVGVLIGLMARGRS